MARIDRLEDFLKCVAAAHLHATHRVSHAVEEGGRCRRRVEPTTLALRIDDGAVIGEQGIAVLLARLERGGEV